MSYLRTVILLLLALITGEAASEGRTMPGTIQEVKAQHQKSLLAMPGVVSVGIGRGPDGKPVIVIGLDRPRPETVKQLPQSLDGHPVRVDVIGPIKAQ